MFKKSLEYNLFKKIIVILTIVLFLDTFFFLYSNYYLLNNEIKSLRNEKIEENKKDLSKLVKISLEILNDYNNKVKNGELTLNEAQKKVKEVIRGIRYDNDNYFWIDNIDYVNVLLPPEKEMEGKSRKDIVDINGVFFVRELVNIAKSNKSGYGIYYFKKIKSGESYPKVGYVELFEPWGWVIGTGFYLDEMDKELLLEQQIKTSNLKSLFKFSIIKDFIIVFLFILFSLNFFSQLKKILKQIFKELNDSKIADSSSKQNNEKGLQEITSEIRKLNEFIIERNSELELLEEVIQNASEGIIILNEKKEVIKVNNFFCKTSGYGKEELIGNNLSKIKSNKHDSFFYNDMWSNLRNFGNWEGKIWNKNKEGDLYESWLTITAIKTASNESNVYLGISSKIDSLKSVEAQMQKLAYTDALTNIANRKFFYETLDKKLKKDESPIIVLAIDLDRFKIINDTLGHSVGDRVLVEISSRLNHLIRKQDVLARLGGDEFAIIIEDTGRSFDIQEYTHQIIDSLGKTINIEEFHLNLSCSIGGVISTLHGDKIEELLMKTDIAMLYAKRTGGRKFYFFSEEMKNENDEFLYIESCIKNALKNDLFYLYLQPKVYKNRLILGAEALIRMKTSEGLLLPPFKFIKIAEDTGLIIELGKWIIEEACRQVSILKNKNIDIHIAVNISIKQIQDDHLIDIFKNNIEKYDIYPNSLEIEITESFFLNDVNKINSVLMELKKMGIKVGIDDFGTGFSSLASLSNLPIDYLKIDKSFIDKLGITGEKELVTTIISIANNLELDIIAEGVETKNQLDILATFENIGIQGYYFSKPLEFQEFIEFYEDFYKKI